ncbi:CGNR zinc finger domain-containing protein [Gryllotalpicola protaetiae]|jgi:predicted RNA-binding Zn ribbon-like protein|uniref:CGNR zinc finger domain-containing protein n=1 Tax=Gryllotalpicola protaetiae TaxID=2419771 RepID=A0A387BL60_9MICO|nr:CGNR zinc finger domain-containing protein [Gryllotalpicola protaetiae]AYG04613.1 CGNR zinc finger domain-containing protein [Gryllotalpicola protaetiae]
MDVNRPAADLVVRVVNAATAGELDVDWTRQLLARESLPIRHRAPGDHIDLASTQRALIKLASDVRPLFESTVLDEAANQLNTLLAELPVRVSVSISDNFAPHLHFDGHGPSIGERLRANGLVALAVLLADTTGLLRLGICAAPDCDLVFVDFSRAGRQRFCSRRCATRSHVAAHRRRIASGLG